MFAFVTVLTRKFDDGESFARRIETGEGKGGEVQGDFEGALVFVSVGKGDSTGEGCGSLIAVAGLNFHCAENREGEVEDGVVVG